MSTAYESLDGVNWSSLKHLATSPRLFRWRQDRPQEDSRAMLLGRAVHCAVLEPEHFAYGYVCQPEFGDLRTKAAKEARDAWRSALRPGAEVLDAADHALACRVAESVRGHSAAAELLRGESEQVLQWQDADTGLACKARVDLLAAGHVLDLKSTRVGTVDSFAREVAQRLYHGQLAYYLDGARAAGRLPDDACAYLIAAQTTEPYDVAALRLSPSALERGRALYRRLLRAYAECQATGQWPGIAPEVLDLELPAWAASDAEEGIW